MKVLFLMFTFPDMNKSFNMYTTLVEEFVNHGHEVVVVAPGNLVTGVYVENNIEILRVKTLPIKNVNNYIKGVSNLFLPFQFSNALRMFYPNLKFNLIISTTPPVTLVDLATKLKKKHHAVFYLILRDIFPQNAVDLQFMKKNSLLYKYFRTKEKKLYRVADYVGCMSQGNINYLSKHNPEIETLKLHELKNFQKLYNNFGNNHSFIRNKYDLENKFVVVFGGNMGKPQQLENVLELAVRCQIYPDVVFLLLGEGLQMDRLVQNIKYKQIKNIKIQKTIPKQEYQDLISICDIGLISLHENFTIPNIPSKSLDYFNVGIPILASIDKATDYGQVLEEGNAGLWAHAGDHEQLKVCFDLLYKNRKLREDFGKNGRAYFEKYLTPDKAFHTIISQLGCQ